MSSQLSTETISRLAGSAHQPQSMKRREEATCFHSKYEHFSWDGVLWNYLLLQNKW